MRGQGVALADEQFVIEEIETGRLVRPFDTSISYGAYWLVARSFDALPQPASSFVLWLEKHWRIGSSGPAFPASDSEQPREDAGDGTDRPA